MFSLQASHSKKKKRRKEKRWWTVTVTETKPDKKNQAKDFDEKRIIQRAHVHETFSMLKFDIRNFSVEKLYSIWLNVKAYVLHQSYGRTASRIRISKFQV